jgi:ABC-type antimicrobial peptide transport system permease subunit
VYAADPTVPVAELQPLDTLLMNSLGKPRLLAQLLSVFAVAGLLLGVVGVYGLVAYTVRQRERELGIRVALGAIPSRIVAMVVGQGALIATIGLAVGLPAAFLLAGVMRGVIFGIELRDPVTFLTLPMLVLLAAIAASSLPARHAALVDPARTIKDE